MVPDHGDQSYFELILTATDSTGQTGTASVSIQPQTVQITLNTSPAGLQVVYGGVSGAAPFTNVAIVGSTRTIFTPSPQGSQTFTSWSDGGAQQHNITVGAANATFTATFGGATVDTTAPTVTSVSPPDASTGASVTAVVTATFSEPMNAATITASTFTLTAQGAASPVAAAVTYDSATNTARLAPASALAAGTVYAARVKGGAGGVTDTAGNALAVDRTWSFTTAAATAPPTVTTVSPANGATGVNANVMPRATFSKAMNPATLTTSTVFMVRNGTTTPVPASVTYNSTSFSVTLNPNSRLAAGTAYTVTVKGGTSGAKDTSGNALASDRVWTFTTR